MNLGEAIKFYRNEKGLSIKGLSKESGISVPYISRLESEEKRSPTVHVVKRLSTVFKVELYDFVKDDYIEKSK